MKDLSGGGFDLVLVPDSALASRLAGNSTQRVSFSDDGRKLAYVESSGGGLTATSIPLVLDIATGARVNAATLSNGTVGNGNVTNNVLLSRNGNAAAFGNNSTNLLAGRSTVQQVYRKLLP